MTIKSWAWDRVPSDQRGQLILGNHLVRCCVEIAGAIAVGAVQMAFYRLVDRKAKGEASE